MIRDASQKMYKVDDGFYVLSTWPREDSKTGEKMMPIWRVQNDGSGKEIVGEIPDASVVNYTVFQDKIYYTMEDIRTDGNYQFSVWQMSLDGKEKKQIWQGDLYSGYISTLQGIGEWLYEVRADVRRLLTGRMRTTLILKNCLHEQIYICISRNQRNG